MVKKYLTNNGVKPGKLRPKDGECRIGFCEDNQKWYGWNYNGEIRGFGIGSTIKKCHNIKAKYNLPVGFEAKTLDDSKLIAIAFAD